LAKERERKKKRKTKKLMYLRSHFFPGKDFRDDVSGCVSQAKFFRRERDLGRGALVAGVEDGHGRRIVALVGWHDGTNKNVNFSVLKSSKCFTLKMFFLNNSFCWSQESNCQRCMLLLAQVLIYQSFAGKWPFK